MLQSYDVTGQSPGGGGGGGQVINVGFIGTGNPRQKETHN